jgi:TATA-box binding protein (TBP) (component of TFIID and TFIIIB)
MPQAVKHFIEVFCIKPELEKASDMRYVIDNYQGSGAFNTSIELHFFQKWIEFQEYPNLQPLKITYNREHCAGMYMQIGRFAKLILYGTGRYSIVGANGRASMLKAFKIVALLLSVYKNKKYPSTEVFEVPNALNWDNRSDSTDIYQKPPAEIDAFKTPHRRGIAKPIHP